MITVPWKGVRQVSSDRYLTSCHQLHQYWQLCDTEMSYYGAGVSHWPGHTGTAGIDLCLAGGGLCRYLCTSVHTVPSVPVLHARFRYSSPVSTLPSAACPVSYQGEVNPSFPSDNMFSCCCRGQKETKKRKKASVVVTECPSSPAYEPSLVFTPHSPIFTIQSSNNVQSSSLSSEDFYYYQATKYYYLRLLRFLSLLDNLRTLGLVSNTKIEFRIFHFCWP